MKQGEITPQADDATRYTYECPRGTIAIDVSADGSSETSVCTDYHTSGARQARDIRDAERMHAAIMAEAAEDDRS